MKKKVVIVKNGVCRILINPELKDYIGYKHIVNPDLTKVFGVPPEQWALKRNQIVESKAVVYDKISVPMAVAALCLQPAIIIALILLLIC